MEVQPGPQDLPPSSPASAAADARPASASPTPPPGRQARASALAAHKKVAGFIAASGKSIRELRNEVEGKSPTKRAPARRKSAAEKAAEKAAKAAASKPASPAGEQPANGTAAALANGHIDLANGPNGSTQSAPQALTGSGSAANGTSAAHGSSTVNGSASQGIMPAAVPEANGSSAVPIKGVYQPPHGSAPAGAAPAPMQANAANASAAQPAAAGVAPAAHANGVGSATGSGAVKPPASKANGMAGRPVSPASPKPLPALPVKPKTPVVNKLRIVTTPPPAVMTQAAALVSGTHIIGPGGLRPASAGSPGTIISSGVPPAQSSTAAPPGSQGYVLPTRPASLPNGPAAPQQPPRPPAGAPAISPTAVSQSIQSITSSVPLVAAGHSQPRPPVVVAAPSTGTTKPAASSGNAAANAPASSPPRPASLPSLLAPCYVPRQGPPTSLTSSIPSLASSVAAQLHAHGLHKHVPPHLLQLPAQPIGQANAATLPLRPPVPAVLGAATPAVSSPAGAAAAQPASESEAKPEVKRRGKARQPVNVGSTRSRARQQAEAEEDAAADGTEVSASAADGAVSADAVGADAQASAEAAAAGTAATAVAEDGKPKRRGGRIKGSKNKPKFDADGNPIKRPQRGAARPKRSVPRDSSEEDEPKRRGKAKVEEDLPEEMDYLHGCTKCRYLKGGCGACRDKPIMERPKSVRWRPEAGRPQKGIPDAPTFYPTPEEFADPLTYIDSIRPEGERCGIACVVPPKGWSPPFALEKGTNGLSAESFRFSIRKQLTSHLCMRLANTSRHNKKSAAGRYDAKKPDMPDDDTFEEHEEDDGEFGFVTLDRTHTLKSFAAYADWVKSCHFGISNAPAAASASQGESEAQASKRRRVAPEKREPSVDEIEAEFWRIVETPDEVVESLYGQDLDSGHHGSGLPLPPFRQKMLEQHLAKTGQAAKVDKDENSGEKRVMTEEDIAYSQHAWNINNLPRCKGSVLRYVIGEELITGVMVPWLYVGSCLSAFCWHVEDHALYSINYLHMGAPKVWYGVPAHSSEALEEAVKDALPHLFEAAPDLLYQLVTMLSPLQLQARGVPVHRVVHREGSFVITFPNAYHAGFNTGFNCAEAVNFGPPDWIPYGTDIIEKYRKDGKATTLSYDALLIALVKAARPVKERMDNSAKQAAVKAEAMEVDAKPEAAVKAEPASVKEEASAAGSGPADAEMAEAEAEVELELEVTAGAAGTAGAAANGSAKLVSVTISPTKPGARKRANASGKAAQDKAAAGHPAGAKAACASGKDGPRVGRTDDISFLDPIEVKDVPPVAVKLGVGELTLRLEEEDRRRAVGLQGAVLKQQRMHGATGAIGEDGLHTDCEDTDCEVCKCDLYLSAIISPACPGRTVCAEHAAALGVRTEQMIMLYRYTMEEMYGWVGEAKRCIPGCDQAVAQAKQRKCTHTSPNQRPAPQVKKLGPVYVMNRPRGRPKSSPTSRRGGKRGPKAGAAKAPPRSKSQDISEAPEDLIVDAAPQPAAAEAANPMPAAAAQPPAMATASAPAPAAAAPAVPAAPAAEAEPAASRRPVRVVPKRKGAEAPETAAKRPRRPKQAPGAKRGAAQPAGTASQGAAGQPGQGDAASQPASSLAALVPAVLQGGFASAWPAALPPPNMSPEYLAGMQQMLAALSDAPPVSQALSAFLPQAGSAPGGAATSQGLPAYLSAQAASLGALASLGLALPGGLQQWQQQLLQASTAGFALVPPVSSAHSAVHGAHAAPPASQPLQPGQAPCIPQQLHQQPQPVFAQHLLPQQLAGQQPQFYYHQGLIIPAKPSLDLSPFVQDYALGAPDAPQPGASAAPAPGAPQPAGAAAPPALHAAAGGPPQAVHPVQSAPAAAPDQQSAAQAQPQGQAGQAQHLPPGVYQLRAPGHAGHAAGHAAQLAHAHHQPGSVGQHAAQHAAQPSAQAPMSAAPQQAQQHAHVPTSQAVAPQRQPTAALAHNPAGRQGHPGSAAAPAAPQQPNTAQQPTVAAAQSAGPAPEPSPVPVPIRIADWQPSFCQPAPVVRFAPALAATRPSWGLPHSVALAQQAQQAAAALERLPAQDTAPAGPAAGDSAIHQRGAMASTARPPAGSLSTASTTSAKGPAAAVDDASSREPACASAAQQPASQAAPPVQQSPAAGQKRSDGSDQPGASEPPQPQQGVSRPAAGPAAVAQPSRSATQQPQMAANQHTLPGQQPGEQQGLSPPSAAHRPGGAAQLSTQGAVGATRQPQVDGVQHAAQQPAPGQEPVGQHPQRHQQTPAQAQVPGREQLVPPPSSAPAAGAAEAPQDPSYSAPPNAQTVHAEPAGTPHAVPALPNQDMPAAGALSPPVPAASWDSRLHGSPARRQGQGEAVDQMPPESPPFDLDALLVDPSTHDPSGMHSVYV